MRTSDFDIYLSEHKYCLSKNTKILKGWNNILIIILLCDWLFQWNIKLSFLKASSAKKHWTPYVRSYFIVSTNFTILSASDLWTRLGNSSIHDIWNFLFLFVSYSSFFPFALRFFSSFLSSLKPYLKQF